MTITIQARQNKVGTYDEEGNAREEYDDPAGRKRCVRTGMDVYITNVSPDVAGEDGFLGGMLGRGASPRPGDGSCGTGRRSTGRPRATRSAGCSACRLLVLCGTPSSLGDYCILRRVYIYWFILLLPSSALPISITLLRHF